MARCANDVVLVVADLCCCGSSPPEKEADDDVRDGERDRRGCNCAANCNVAFAGLVELVGIEGGGAVPLAVVAVAELEGERLVGDLRLRPSLDVDLPEGLSSAERVVFIGGSSNCICNPSPPSTSICDILRSLESGVAGMAR